MDIDLSLSEITTTGFQWKLRCFHTNYFYRYFFNWMASWHPYLQVIEFEENFAGSPISTGSGTRAQIRTLNIIQPKVSVPNSIVVTKGYNLAQVGGTYYYWVHVDSTTKTTVNLKFIAVGGALINSVKGYILIWDNRLSADFGTVGGELDACISGSTLYNFNTIDLDTNSSALNLYFGLSGFHFE